MSASAPLHAPAREADPHRPAAQAIPGLVWAFRFHADGTAEELAVDQPIEDRHDGWLWLHLNLADTRACHWPQAPNPRFVPYVPAR